MSAADAPQRAIVVFDFDGVIVAGDSFASLLRRLIGERWYRRWLAYAAVPVALPLLMSDRFKGRGARVFLRIALLGLRSAELRERLAAFGRTLAADPRRVSGAAVAAVRAHLQRGDRVIVATGSEETLVRAVLDALDLGDAELVASQLDLDGARVAVRQHCFGERKCVALHAHGLERWDVAYTDALADLPLLRRAQRAVLVNAPDSEHRRAEAALARAVERVTWK